MNLLDFNTKDELIIEKIEIDKKLKTRLLSLGVIRDSKVKILNRKINNDLIIKIRGTRLGISREIAKSIFVKKGGNKNNAKEKYCFNRKS